ncbi:ankyrin [Neocallimastix lanati (nom. inval.)]|jgi:ankyrin repeat protein|uniref:Ankyrin n=1 Tax=Neocallimastix californiae TaxID=1754190 RepID=A0A1Y2DJN6_9FUNG|nr:ankyrin [Neocallimastix sp. JGI-2020a]ORY58995.1 ankyrin [Neocallimastix californiae]|eukprot:ORY58995.1 ankyrin [Neocallimastix californiae]
MVLDEVLDKDIINVIINEDYERLIKLCGHPKDILYYLYEKNLLDERAFKLCIKHYCKITSSCINKFIIDEKEEYLNPIFDTLSMDTVQCEEINKSDHNGNLPLIIACKYNKTAIAFRLIKIGAKILVKDSDGNTPLVHACHYNNYDLIAYLIENNKNIINVQNNKGNTVLHLSSISGNIKLFKYLIDHNADFKITNKNNKKPLEILGEGYKILKEVH